MPTRSLSDLLGSVRQWHWISSALFMTGLLLFASTGITLNHADLLDERQAQAIHRAELPAELLRHLHEARANDEEHLPAAVAEWLARHLPGNPARAEAEWDERGVTLEWSRPGVDNWLSLDLQSGTARLEITDHGWIALFNDLHKGRHTGLAWTLFTDAFAVACIVFGVTGFMLLQRQTASRPMTWPLIGLGLLVPLLLLLLSIH